jgi:hypothetical protein
VAEGARERVKVATEGRLKSVSRWALVENQTGDFILCGEIVTPRQSYR